MDWLHKDDRAITPTAATLDAIRSGFAGLDQVLGHRAIGVVYDPARERRGNYVPTVVAPRYDALLFIHETRALDPLHAPALLPAMPETYPTGM